MRIFLAHLELFAPGQLIPWPVVLLQVSLYPGQLSCSRSAYTLASCPASIISFSRFRHALQTRKSDRAETWREALWLHGDSKLLKSVRSDIQDGRHSCRLEILQTTSPPKKDKRKVQGMPQSQTAALPRH